MIITFINLSLRKIRNDLSFSVLSITGLALATVSCTIILLYVGYERSFDNFRANDIYRITYHAFQNEVETGKSAQVVPALAPAMRSDIPEVKSTARLAHTGVFMADPVMQYGDKKFRETSIYFAEDGLLPMFSFKMLAGSAESPLARPDQVVISQSVAEKYFGGENALGKTLTFHRGERGPKEIVVTGVFEDVPLNSHFHCDFLVSFATLELNLDNDWDWGNFYTYIQVQPGITGRSVESKIPDLLKKHIGKYLTETEGDRMEFLLQPIQSIHLESKLWGELETNGDAGTVTFLNIIAIFILFIAWINYINFSIARSSENSKEISIRKINGSSRTLLIMQLMTESAVINLLAVGLSIIIIEATLPLLKLLVGIPASITFGWANGLTLIGIFIGGTLCSGLYPAIYISRLNPVAILKSKISRSAISLTLNKGLIVFQFTASIVLIIGTITVFRQLTFMRDRELGLNLDHTIVVKGPAVKDSTYQSMLSSLKNEAQKIRGIANFALSSSIPGEELHWWRDYSRNDAPQNSIGCAIVAIDENFFDLFDAKFTGGKNYPDGTTAWKDAIIINETAARELGFADPVLAVDQTILWHENDQHLPKTVIGVVRDFNQQSLRRKVEPIVFTLKKYVFAPWAGEFFSFKVNGTDTGASLNGIEKLWTTVFPKNPFDYFFLDDYFNAQYKNDDRFGVVFTVFSTLAIFIASLGLFGLTAYMTTMRTKEIGVRKVLGSSTFQLVSLLSGDYLKLVLIAFIIACPVAMILVEKWLAQFAYRVPISIWIFISAGMLCFLVALLTVSVKSWQSANLDPVKALKYE
ncbi:MAG TPA: ABC transporter permease [Chryseolinea sp.]